MPPISLTISLCHRGAHSICDTLPRCSRDVDPKLTGAFGQLVVEGECGA